MKKIIPILYLFCISCSDFFLTEKEIECEIPEPHFTYSENIEPILDANCTVCHNSNSQSGGLSLSSLEDFNLSNYLTPGDTTQGSILNRIQNTQNPMPPYGLMNPENIEMIKIWILECAIEN